MLVDDEPFNLLILESMLKTMNIKSVKANNGVELLNQFENKSRLCCNANCSVYRLILMDY